MKKEAKSEKTSTHMTWLHKKELEAALKQQGDWVNIVEVYDANAKLPSRFKTVFVNGEEVHL